MDEWPAPPGDTVVDDLLIAGGTAYAVSWPAQAQQPKPPPEDMPVDPAKWAALTREERRALVRHHRRVTRE